MPVPAHPTGGVLLFGPAGPGQGMKQLTPSDTNDIATSPCRSLYISANGTVSAIGVDGVTFTLPSITAPFILPVGITRLLSTGTSATVFAIW